MLTLKRNLAEPEAFYPVATTSDLRGSDQFMDNLAVYESGAAHKMRDVCFMMGAVVIAVVFSPLVPLFFLYEAIVNRRRAPDYSHMNGHALH